MESQAKQLFRTSFSGMSTKRSQIGRGLDMLMAGWPNAKPNGEALALYCAVLDTLNSEEIITAFARGSADEWFPSPGRLIALSGHADAVDATALRELLALAAVLYEWPMLQPRAGAVLDGGRDPQTHEYLPVDQVRREAPVMPPVMAAVVRDTVRALGDGDIRAGLRRISVAVPGLLGKLGDDQSFELRQAENVKRAWVEAYRRVVA